MGRAVGRDVAGLHYLGVYRAMFARAIARDLANAGVREGITDMDAAAHGVNAAVATAWSLCLYM